jgi:hypothetical protein
VFVSFAKRVSEVLRPSNNRVERAHGMRSDSQRRSAVVSGSHRALGFKVNLAHCIEQAFPEGLSYQEAAQLCLRLYCTVEGIPEHLHPQCSMDKLAETSQILRTNSF